MGVPREQQSQIDRYSKAFFARKSGISTSKIIKQSRWIVSGQLPGK